MLDGNFYKYHTHCTILGSMLMLIFLPLLWVQSKYGHCESINIYLMKVWCKTKICISGTEIAQDKHFEIWIIHANLMDCSERNLSPP